MKSINKEIMAALLLAAASASQSHGQTNVLTYHNDLSRTGANLNESILSQTNVNNGSFGKLFSYTVDGYVFAQPLYMGGVPINGNGRHNVVFVATEGDSIYAFDADSASGANAKPLWHVSFTNGTNITTEPASLTGGEDDNFGCFSVNPQIGITSTPVIDPSSMTLYAVALTKEVWGASVNYVHRLHAIDITTGLERPGSGVAVSGVGGVYNPRYMVQRTGLLLLSGNIYMGFASMCDKENYNGMMLSFNASTLQQNGYSFMTNDPYLYGDGGGIWGSGGAPAVDQSGNIYIATGNGNFDGKHFFSCSLLKLNSQLQLTDYFAPADVNTNLNPNDLDLGSSMPILLPDSVGSPQHPHLMAIAGKGVYMYLVDRDNLEQWEPTSYTLLPATPYYVGGDVFGKGVYFDSKVFFSPGFQPVQSISIANAQLSPGTQTSSPYNYWAGPGLSLSANGTSQGILWVLARNDNGQAALQALNPNNLQTQFYTSDNGVDGPGGYIQFSVPTIAQGKVFAAATADSINGSLAVYGLKNATCATDVSSQVSVTRGGWLYNHTTNSYIETLTLTNKGTTAVGPVSVAIDNLNPAARLTSASGTTTCGAITGSFFQNAVLANNSLAPGQSVPVYISATDPLPETIGFDVRILGGPGMR